MGDVTHILDDEGDIVAEYVYDAWGNCEIIHSVGGMAELNAIRYRGYYYDVETGLYYLKSRYYDAKTGRFISMDAIGILNTAQNYINGLNLYAYANNNPVMNIDENGFFWRRIWQGITTVGGAIIGGVANYFIFMFFGESFGGLSSLFISWIPLMAFTASKISGTSYTLS